MQKCLTKCYQIKFCCLFYCLQKDYVHWIFTSHLQATDNQGIFLIKIREVWCQVGKNFFFVVFLLCSYVLFFVNLKTIFFSSFSNFLLHIYLSVITTMTSEHKLLKKGLIFIPVINFFICINPDLYKIVFVTNQSKI